MADVNWAHPVAMPATRRARSGRTSPVRPVLTGMLATLVGIAIGAGAWAIAHAGAPAAPESLHANVDVRPDVALLAGAASPALLDEAKVGSQIATTDWVAAVRAYATSRTTVAGTMEIRVHPAGDKNLVVGSQAIEFGVAASGHYSIAYPGETAFSTTDGTQVQVNDARKLVMIQAGAPTAVPGMPPWALANGELDLPNDAISRILYPGRWIELMQTGNEVTVVYAGADVVNGRPVKRYAVTFGTSTTKYSAQGWEFALDATSGVLVQYVIYYSDAAGGGSEEVQVVNLNEKAFAVPDSNVSLPVGYRVQALVYVAGGMAVANDETGAGDTVGTLVERATASESTAAPSQERASAGEGG